MPLKSREKQCLTHASTWFVVLLCFCGGTLMGKKDENTSVPWLPVPYLFSVSVRPSHARDQSHRRVQPFLQSVTLGITHSWHVYTVQPLLRALCWQLLITSLQHTWVLLEGLAQNWGAEIRGSTSLCRSFTVLIWSSGQARLSMQTHWLLQFPNLTPLFQICPWTMAWCVGYHGVWRREGLQEKYSGSL